MSDTRSTGPTHGRQTPTTWAHYCVQCREGAMFGFIDRRGDQSWYCMVHRDLARIQAQHPSRLER